MTLPGIAQGELLGFALVLSRVAPLFLLAPIFSSRFIPTQAKLVAAFAISVAVTPIARHGQAITDDPIRLTQLLVKEMGVGIAFALALGALAAAVSAAGSLLDTIAGFSFGAVMDPITGVQSAVFAQLYAVFASMVLVLGGGDHLMIEGVARSYALVPLGVMPQPAAFVSLATTGLTQVAVVGIELAAPVLVALVVADAALGLVARAVPQMNVFVVGLPAKIILAFAVVGASLPFVGMHLQDQLQHVLFQTLETLRVR